MTRSPSGGSRAGLLVPAGLAVALVAVPLLALLLRADWANVLEHLADPAVLPAIRLSLATTTTTVVLAVLLGTPLAWLLARSRGRRSRLVPGGAHRAAGAPTGGRRRGPADGVRQAWRGRRSPVRGLRGARAVHAGRRRAGRALRRHAVLRHRGRGGHAQHRPTPRARGRDPGRLTLAVLHPRRPAARRPRHGRRRGPGLGQGARGVRGDDHLRGQLRRAAPRRRHWRST